jgi:hypothetical protein
MRLMTRQTARLMLGGVLLAWVAAAVPAEARRKPQQLPPPFEYVGGTEAVPPSCAGNLEVGSDSLIFKCSNTEFSMPFAAISLMQYRSDVSYRVSKLAVHWKAFPGKQGGNRNRFFTIVYTHPAATHVIILQVAPQSMRPYLAEIELKSGKRVEVEGYEYYQ